MERYIDTMHGTGATIAQSTEVARMAVDSINLEADSECPPPAQIAICRITLTPSVAMEDKVKHDDSQSPDSTYTLRELLCELPCPGVLKGKVDFQVGECRSLIFGVSLTDYDFTRPEGTAHGDPPIIVEKCIAAIDERGESSLVLSASQADHNRSGRRGNLQDQRAQAWHPECKNLAIDVAGIGDGCSTTDHPRHREG